MPVRYRTASLSDFDGMVPVLTHTPPTTSRLLHHGSPPAELGRRDGRFLPAGAAPDHQQVIVEIAHVMPPTRGDGQRLTESKRLATGAATGGSTRREPEPAGHGVTLTTWT